MCVLNTHYIHKQGVCVCVYIVYITLTHTHTRLVCACACIKDTVCACVLESAIFTISVNFSFHHQTSLWDQVFLDFSLDFRPFLKLFPALLLRCRSSVSFRVGGLCFLRSYLHRGLSSRRSTIHGWGEVFYTGLGFVCFLIFWISLCWPSRGSKNDECSSMASATTTTSPTSTKVNRP